MLRLLGFCAMLAVAACSNDGGVPNGVETSIDLLRSDPDGITRRFQALQGTPRPIMQIGLIDAGTAGNMLLEARNGPYEHFLSPNAASMIFNDGILHQTIGFGEPLMAVEVNLAKSFILGARSGTADRTHTYITGDDSQIFRSYRCAIFASDRQTIQLPNRTAKTILMRERCQNAEQAFENLYWVEQSRRQIVQSRQWAGPNLGAVSTRRAGLSQ